jgi:hypothetical protein
LTSNCPFPSDLQEPFHWIADVTVMDALENAKSNDSLKMYQKARDKLKTLTVSTGGERVR